MQYKESDLEIPAGVPVKLSNEILQRYIAPGCVNPSDWGAMALGWVSKRDKNTRSGCDGKQEAERGRNFGLFYCTTLG